MNRERPRATLGSVRTLSWWTAPAHDDDSRHLMIAVTSLSVAGLTGWLAGVNAGRPGVDVRLILVCAAVWALLASVHLGRRQRLTRIELLLILMAAASALTAIGAFSGAAAEPAVCAVALTNIPLVAALLGAHRPVLVTSSAASLLGILTITAQQVDSPGLALCAAASISAASLAPAVYIVTQQRQLELAREEAVQLSLRDPLTGLLNRRGMDLGVGRLLETRAPDGESLAAVVIDIDHFKAINDTFGHGRGDETLRAIARVLHSTGRDGDLHVRLGGEELAWVAMWDERSAVEAADRLRAAVEAMAVPGIDRQLTVSAGVSVEAPGSSGDVRRRTEALLERADEALYEAKRSGRNRIVLAASRSSAPPAPGATLTSRERTASPSR